jgi:hypothetical protein
MMGYLKAYALAVALGLSLTGSRLHGDERARNGLLVLHAKFTHATPSLAKFHGLPVHHGAGLARYDLADVPERGGVLTQGSVLTVGGDEASTVTRGLFLLNDILRGTVNNPPPPERSVAIVFCIHGLEAIWLHPGFIDLIIGSARNALNLEVTETTAVHTPGSLMNPLPLQTPVPRLCCICNTNLGASGRTTNQLPPATRPATAPRRS